MHELLDCLGGELVHHLQAGGDDPRRDDAGHRVPGPDHRVERGQHDLRFHRLGQQLDRDLGGHREQALRAGEQGEQIVTRRIEPIAADLQDLALDRHHAQLEHVVHGQPVLQAMHAAGVLGDVAADGASDLAGRVGGVVQAVGSGRFGDSQVTHAGLYARDPGNRIDLQDALHLRQAERDALRVRHGAAREPGAGAARDHRYPQPRDRYAGPRSPAPRPRAVPRPAAAGDRQSVRRTRTASGPPPHAAGRRAAALYPGAAPARPCPP